MDDKLIIVYGRKTDDGKPRRQLLNVAKCVAGNLGLRCVVAGQAESWGKVCEKADNRIAFLPQKHPFLFVIRHLRHAEMVLADGQNTIPWGARLLRLFCPGLRIVSLESLGVADGWSEEETNYYVNHTLLPRLGYEPLAFAHNF